MKLLLKTVVVLLLLAAAAAWTFYRHPLWVADQRIRLHLRQAKVRSEYVDVDGYRLHFLEAAAPAGTPDRPLVLIHGLGSRGEDWSPLIPSLAAQGFHVYVPDLLGYGRSPQPDVSYSITLEEKIVADFLDAVHVPQADVGGWSMGGWVAMKLAVDHPGRVRRLLLYDSAGTYFKQLPVPGLFTPSDPAGLARLMAAISPHPRAMPPFIARDAIRKLQRNAWVVNRSMNQMQAGQDLMNSRLHEIQQPTLVVWGGADALIPPSTGEAIHRGIAGSVLEVVDGCGHLAPAECWKPVLGVTLDFLKAEPAPAGGEHHVPGE